MERFATALIYAHAFLGGIGLLTGLFNTILQKGTAVHKKIGKAFTYALSGSTILSLLICLFPKHQNPFLFLIGTLTIYLIVTGNRALCFRSHNHSNTIDKYISAAMCVLSVLMILVGLFCFGAGKGNAILFSFFGALGTYTTIKDFSFYKNKSDYLKNWLPQHISKLTGALIASITAFMVAGLHFENLAAWLLPTFIGTVYIKYWITKTTKNPQSNSR